MISDVEIAEWLSVAKEAALIAGTYLLNPDQSNRNINLNTRRDIKIAADVGSESIILNYLEKKSDFSILSEESGTVERCDRGFTWIVDPLDGSLNYSRGIALCCVSVGLWQGRRPILGAVYDFYHSELYTGIIGKGAWWEKIRIFRI